MTIRIIPYLLSIISAIALTGCVAAVIPVAVGGIIGKTTMDRKPDSMPSAQDSEDPADPVERPGSSVPIALSSTTPMEAGKPYSGNLPVPAPRPVPSPTPDPPPHASTPPQAASGWNRILHYLADASLQHQEHSVLPIGSSVDGPPRWVACGDKPRAIVTNLDLAFGADAGDHLSAIETMGLTIVYTAPYPVDVALQKARRLARGVRTPVADDTLLALPAGREAATRAAIGRRYCIIAIVGDSPADFPNGIVPGQPGAGPGWFRIERPR